MGIYKISYHEEERRINLYNYGCNFKCKGCSYKLIGEVVQKRSLKIREIITIINIYNPKIVNFIGGAPCTNPQLPKIVDFLKKNTDIIIHIGHSNGSILPPLEIDLIRISIKTYSEALHRDYTGVSNKNILKNFKLLHQANVSLDASTTYIPNYIDKEEIEKIAKFISKIDKKIPYRIIGYIPVPGTVWRRPTREEIVEAVKIARKYLANVTFSCYSPEEVGNMAKIDSRYNSKLVKQVS